MILLPAAAYANAGTPLMWASAFHLLIGNAVIGLIEGGILIDYFGAPKAKTIGLLILANYFSSWVGSFFIGSRITDMLPMDINNARVFFWVMVVITFLMTLVLEYPFIYVAFHRDPHRLRKSITGTLATQTASYILLFGLYWMVSGTSLLTKTDVVQLSRIPLPNEVSMYFISPDDGNVYVRKFSSSGTRKVFDLHSSDRNDRLFVRKSQSDEKLWDIAARLDTKDYQLPRIVPIIDAKRMQIAPSWRSKLKNPGEEPDTWFNIGPVAKLGSADNSVWDFEAGFWAAEGLRGTENKTGAKAGFSYETPFGSWMVRNATHLPGDKVLFQLGYDQICVYDPLTNRIALVAKGRGPVAVIETDQ